MQNPISIWDLRAKYWGSFIEFCEVFFPLVTGRPFYISQPIGRESHVITIAKTFTKIKNLELLYEQINIPPGHGKSTLACLFVAWIMSEFPNSQFLYISYGHEIAAKHTEFIRRIMSCPDYVNLFDVHIRHDSKAKDHFMTTAGGSVKAFGSSGAITGHDAGLPNCDHISGAVIMDDMHKPDEVHSQTIRLGVINNYKETIVQRLRAANVPMLFIGQRLHEDDLPAYMLSGNDEFVWDNIILQAIDGAGNVLYPEVTPLAQLLEKKEKSPYVFASQYQQEPIPSGGALYKEKDFIILDQEPDFVCTFITADTAETSKTYNDATAFSFWGLYKLNFDDQEIDQYALHWIDCVEIWIEPKDLEYQFRSFYGECMLHQTKPRIAAIEKKSTGTTLCSVLDDMRGLQIREVKRTKYSGSKTVRYLEIQPIIAAKLISFTYGAKHMPMCIEHMLKITANDSHRRDDICDTVYDGIKIALIDQTLYERDNRDERIKTASSLTAAAFAQRANALNRSRGY